MATRTLYLVRHGAADALGRLTPEGEQQSRLLGRRLADVPMDAVWHSPVPRAAASAQVLAAELTGPTYLEAADELVDHVPFVPERASLSPSWRGFFDGYDDADAVAGRRIADALVDRFAHAHRPGQRATHECLVTHAYPIAWLVRDALNAPPAAWLSVTGLANAALSIIEYPPDEPPTLVLLNDQSHLAPTLRWTGFREARP